MKRICFVLILLSFVACEKDAFEEIYTEVENETPQETPPSFTVRVTGADEILLPGSQVAIYEDTTLIAEKVTDANGEITVSLGDLSSTQSTMYLIASKEEYLQQAKRIEQETFQQEDVTLKMKPKSSNLIGISGNLRSMMRSQVIQVSGKIISPNENDYPSFFLVYAAEERVFQGDTTGFSMLLEPEDLSEEGIYEFLAPANTELLFMVLDFRLCNPAGLTSYRDSDYEVGGNLFAEWIGPFSSDAVLSDTEILPNPPLGVIEVTGTVVDCDGAPISGANIDLASSVFGPLSSEEIRTDANGMFEQQLVTCGIGEQGYVTVSVMQEGVRLGTYSQFFTTDENTIIPIEFGILTGCTPVSNNLFEIIGTDGSTHLSYNFEVNYDPTNPDLGISLISPSGSQQAVTLNLTRSNGMWTGSVLEFDANGDGTKLLTNDQVPFEVQVTDTGTELQINWVEAALTYESGPRAGSSYLFNGNVVAEY